MSPDYLEARQRTSEAEQRARDAHWEAGKAERDLRQFLLFVALPFFLLTIILPLIIITALTAAGQ